MRLRTLRELPVPTPGRERAFVRVDFNVPLRDGRVVNDARIRAAIPTITGLLRRGYRPVLASHLGRPKGRPVPELSLAPVAARLRELLGLPVRFNPRLPTDPELPFEVADLPAATVMLLENLRFVPEEEADDAAFGERLASLGVVTVQDAFGAVHRAHASTHAVYRTRPAYAGVLLEREVVALSRLLDPPERPFAVIIGGAKISDKLGVVANLAERADVVFLGGALANTVLLAAGFEVGRSLAEPDQVEPARRLLDRFGHKIRLPRDVRVATDAKGEAVVVPADRIPAELAVYDIGPRTVESWTPELLRARTVFWNGPMGLYEESTFIYGTRAVAHLVASVEGFTVVGGGDSLAAIADLGLEDRISHLSTGGGASLEFLEGRPLPGLAGVVEG